MKTLLSLACLLLVCQVVRAGDTKAAATAKGGPNVNVTPATTGTDAADDDAYVPKSKSVFTATTDDHNPFWPIGWSKMESLSPDAVAPINPHVEDFTVTTIMLNEPPMAVINGKDMAEGEVASLTLNSGQAAVVQLVAVKDGLVVLRWQNQNLVVPLHRQEELTEATPTPTTAAVAP